MPNRPLPFFPSSASEDAVNIPLVDIYEIVPERCTLHCLRGHGDTTQDATYTFDKSDKAEELLAATRELWLASVSDGCCAVRGGYELKVSASTDDVVDDAYLWIPA